jgi:hypothetical protein
MKFVQALAVLFTTASLAACQPPPAEETPAPEVTAAEASAAMPCGIIAHRGWTASRSTGSTPALTIAGEVDLGTPGYSVSLARDPADTADTVEPRLLLTLTPPTAMVTEVVTAHPVHYFGPAPNAITTVHIACDGQDITSIAVTAQ